MKPKPPMNANETRCALALSRMGYHNIAALRELYNVWGSMADIVRLHAHPEQLAPNMPERLLAAFAHTDEHLKRADEEMRFAQDNNISIITLADEAYPQRLKECDDAPLALFFKGNANLNAKHCISIVGTRKATPYAADCIAQITARLKQLCPDILIVSGLAYGVDIMAHRQAIDHALPTVAVLAHGLDTLYPSRHRKEATLMMQNGGLLTEYFSQSKIDKRNFLQRNRIVAGMSAATLLVESAEHGGGLVTCRLAQSYQRDVFAIPGNINNPYSVGCNRLIRDNVAGLVTSAEDILKAMSWEEDVLEVSTATSSSRGASSTNTYSLNTSSKNSSSRYSSSISSFGNSVSGVGTTSASTAKVPNGAQAVLDVLTKENDLHIDIIATRAGLPVNKVLALLFQLEMSGMVSSLSGSRYHKVNS